MANRAHHHIPSPNNDLTKVVTKEDTQVERIITGQNQPQQSMETQNCKHLDAVNLIRSDDSSLVIKVNAYCLIRTSPNPVSEDVNIH